MEIIKYIIIILVHAVILYIKISIAIIVYYSIIYIVLIWYTMYDILRYIIYGIYKLTYYLSIFIY